MYFTRLLYISIIRRCIFIYILFKSSGYLFMYYLRRKYINYISTNFTFLWLWYTYHVSKLMLLLRPAFEISGRCRKTESSILFKIFKKHKHSVRYGSRIIQLKIKIAFSKIKKKKNTISYEFARWLGLESDYVKDRIRLVMATTNISICILNGGDWIMGSRDRIYAVSKEDRQTEQSVSWIAARYPELLTLLYFSPSRFRNPRADDFHRNDEQFQISSPET